MNSRLTLFGLVVGSGVGGAIASGAEFGLSRMLHIPGGMYALMVFAVLGAVLCMRIPKRVESTAGEVPTTLSYTGAMARDAERQADRGQDAESGRAKLGAAFKNLRVPLGRSVVTGLWGNTTIRVLTGFLTLYIAFYSKAQQAAGGSATESLLMIGAVGAAAGIGNFIGNGIGARLQLPRPARIVVQATVAATVGAIVAAVFGNLVVVAAVTFIASGVSALGKVSLDASIQDDLPDESRASAFGRSRRRCSSAGSAAPRSASCCRPRCGSASRPSPRSWSSAPCRRCSPTAAARSSRTSAASGRNTSHPR